MLTLLDRCYNWLPGDQEGFASIVKAYVFANSDSPMVAMVVSRSKFFKESDRLRSRLERRGVDVDGCYVNIESTYFPASGRHIILLTGVDDKLFLSARTTTLVKEIQGIVADNIGLHLTVAQVEEILDNQMIADEIEVNGANDTETRSLICSYLTQKILGRPIPTYGETQKLGINMEAFWAELAQKGAEMGYSSVKP